MKKSNTSYSFEEYNRIPRITQNTTDFTKFSLLPTISKKLDDEKNDKIYTRISNNIAIQKEKTALQNNNTCRNYGHFQSQKTYGTVKLGTLSLSRKESTEQIQQDHFNKDLLIQPTSRNFIDTRIQNKGQNNSLKDSISTRFDPLPNVNVRTACRVTNDDRLFGNVVPSNRHNGGVLEGQELTRRSDLDYNKLYDYQSKKVISDDADHRRYNEAKCKAHHEHLALPHLNAFGCLNKNNFGVLCRNSLPDDDTITQRLFDLGPNEQCPLPTKNDASIRVFPLTKDNVQTASTRQPKSHNTVQNENEYMFETAPFLQAKFDEIQKNAQSTFTKPRESSRKTQNVTIDANGTYVLSTIGTKPPRRPLSQVPSIGINTTQPTILQCN